MQLRTIALRSMSRPCPRSALGNTIISAGRDAQMEQDERNARRAAAKWPMQRGLAVHGAARARYEAEKPRRC